MNTVDSERILPLVDFLTNIYGDLETVSDVSGIPCTVLSGVEVDDAHARRLVEFVLAHRRKSGMISVYENDERPRFATPEEILDFDAEERLLRAERIRYGY